MRTTLDLDDDVLASAKEIARREGRTAGQVLSDLARRALTRQATPEAATKAATNTAAHGFAPFAARGALVTNAVVQALRDQDEY
jgi:hypothetical protein